MDQGGRCSLFERRSRRSGWIRGVPVRLADGTTWHLPDVSIEVMLTIPGMVDDLIDLFRLAEDIAGASPGADESVRITAVTLFHRLMIEAGVRLLRTNYDLPDGDWPKLTRFGDLAEAMTFANTVAGSAFTASGCTIPHLAQPAGVEASVHGWN